MIFDRLHFTQITNGDFNALHFSLFGMGIVFTGLVLIAVYIFLLPKILSLGKASKKTNTEAPAENDNEFEILLAIAAAAHLHLNFPEGNERITWKSHGDPESPWLVSGRMQSLGTRKRRNSWNRR